MDVREASKIRPPLGPILYVLHLCKLLVLAPPCDQTNPVIRDGACTSAGSAAQGGEGVARVSSEETARLVMFTHTLGGGGGGTGCGQLNDRFTVGAGHTYLIVIFQRKSANASPNQSHSRAATASGLNGKNVINSFIREATYFYCFEKRCLVISLSRTLILASFEGRNDRKNPSGHEMFL